jgi:hypothetical protein
MSLVPFQSLPDTSKLWIFAADRKLSAGEAAQFQSATEQFLSTWQAHGVPVESGMELRYNQFVLVAANEDVTHPSGCSIDALTREIQALGAKFGVSVMNGAKVFYREGDVIKMVDRPAFRHLAANQEVHLDSVVFDNSLTTLGELRRGKWETAARDSWHSQAFKMQPVTVAL